MPNLLAMSFEGELAPSFDLRCLHPGRTPPDGWGIGYYPGGEPSATVLKEPRPPTGSIRSELVKAWEHLESSIFVVHIRTATWGGQTDANTQPFARAWGGRDWLFAHGGSLVDREPIARHPGFEPVGSTDSEAILCDLLGRMAERGWRSIGDADPAALLQWYAQLDELGSMTSVLTDGRDLVVYADRGPDAKGIYLWDVLPPYTVLRVGDPDLLVDLGARGVRARRGLVVSSDPTELTCDRKGAWCTVPPGSLVVVRQGRVREELGPVPTRETGLAHRPRPHPRRAEVRRYDVTHRTAYRYDDPVEHSTHLFRLVPFHDRLQTVHRSELSVSVGGVTRDYEDMFGNQTRRLVVDSSYTELVIEARSTVEVLDVDPLAYSPLRARTDIPLVWMPWHRQVLQPFLLPPELPESELDELVEYAMSFVERNDDDLLETLLDLNDTIHREYQYVQRATTLATTPFEVYATRRGVCQDFTNLFICVARLLGVPARYVCGYLHTGPRSDSRAPSDESHAWAQVYLPEVGWRGFDPTNGVLTQTDHVRVAVGRNYRDATPTSGTIYVGGGGERLEVAVRVERVG
jgi:transglutaminase-like putative cysteine protease/predicted glutamine amidotransferase